MAWRCAQWPASLVTHQGDHHGPARHHRTPARYFNDFGAALRYWRNRRGVSQLRLAVDAAVSQRHLSFLERRRAQPGRELVLRLGIALDISLRQRNAMLLAAGFAPAYRERSLRDPELDAVKRALDFMLAQQAPFPALVVDRLWNLVMLNEPAARMMRFFLGTPHDVTVHELRLESLFPADAPSRAWFERQAP